MRWITRTDVLVFMLLFGSFAWFQHSEPGWNVNSRLSLTLALADTGRPQVERYAVRPELYTEDLARYEGHLYSDKSIGTSLLGVPAALAIKACEAATNSSISMATRRYLITLFSVGLAGAIAGVLLMRWLSIIWRNSEEDVRLDSAISDRRFMGQAAFVSLAVMLGSMLFLYGTLFMSYLPATACLLAGLLSIELALSSANRTFDSASGLRYGLFLVAGVFMGLAGLCEYLYAAAAAFAGVYLFARLFCQSAHSPRQISISSLAYIAGGIIGIAPFLFYSISIFGRPAIPYEYHVMPQFRAAMAQGFMGATWPPDGDVLWLITFHPFRGIFVYSPALLMGVGGLVWMLARPAKIAATPARLLAILCLFTAAFYVAFNSAYYMWWGGWSFAPRHLAPAIPFMAAGLAPWLRRKAGQWIFGAAAMVGVFVHILVNATEPQPPDGGWQTALLRPDLTAFDYPAEFIHDTWRRVTAGAFDRNLGVAIGLPQNLWSLAPLILWWIIIGALIYQSVRYKSVRKDAAD